MHELRSYLEMLLGHPCGGGECPDCQHLQRIYSFIQNELFTTVVYAETPLSPHPGSGPQTRPVIRAAPSLHPPPAG
ncbi:MAG: hypothetical protein ACLP59_15270 [Bryobacteraceae bacterium]